ncbi:MAG: peroxiredoxin family protein [Gammaproteobacteria bacterium]|nr:peroxiredoxin family protein [Gammaproteobacteria bacterium]
MDAIRGLGGDVTAMSVDAQDKASELETDIKFPLGYGVNREAATQLGSFWEERRQIIQPSEFIVNAQGKVLLSMYSSGPLGRINPPDIVRFLSFLESQK